MSLFDKKVPFSERPTPIKLEINLDDLQKYGIKDFTFLPAKFDENKESLEIHHKWVQRIYLNMESRQGY